MTKRHFTFGDVVRQQRCRLGLSQEELAQKIGISRNYVSLIERNKATNLSVWIVANLARAFGIDMCHLFRMYVFEILAMGVEEETEDEHNTSEV